MKDAHVTRVGHRRVQGWVRQHGGGYQSHDAKLQFDIRFDKPFDSMRGWRGSNLASGGEPIDELSGDQMGFFVRYDRLPRTRRRADEGRPVPRRSRGRDAATSRPRPPAGASTGSSRVSQRRWNDMLGRIDVGGGTRQQQVKFYTDMFHVLCGRSVTSDADGRYMDDTWNANRIARIPRGANGQPKFAMYNYDALWLTQWNVNSVLGLAYPGGLLELRAVAAADVPRRRAAAARPGGGQRLAGDDRLAGDQLHHRRVEQGHPRLRPEAGLRGDARRARRRRAVREVRVRVRRLERRRRRARLPAPRLCAAGARRWPAQRRRRDDARVRAPGLGAGPVRAAAQGARLQRRADCARDVLLAGGLVQRRAGAGGRRPAAARGRGRVGLAGETQPWIQLDWDQPQKLRQGGARATARAQARTRTRAC